MQGLWCSSPVTSSACVSGGGLARCCSTRWADAPGVAAGVGAGLAAGEDSGAGAVPTALAALRTSHIPGS